MKIYNPFLPLVSCPAPYKSSQQCRQPFPGNKITVPYLNTVGLNIASSLPLPNEAVTTYGASDYFQSLFYSRHANEFIGKVDHQLFSWWYANFSYVHFGSTVPSTTALGGLAGKTLSDVLYRKVDAIAQNDTITVNPTTVLTVGYGFNRFPNTYVDDLKGFNQQTLGFPAAYVNALQVSAFPNITMQTAASRASTALAMRSSIRAVWSRPLRKPLDGTVLSRALTSVLSARILPTPAFQTEPIPSRIHSPRNCRMLVM